MKALLWCRISDEEQEIASQREALEAEAARRNLTIYATWEVEGSAYKSHHAQRLTDALSLAQRHAFDVLLVWSINRLSREGTFKTLEWVRRFELAGCQVYSVQEPWLEQMGTFRDALLGLLGWIYQEESRLKSETTKRGLYKAMKAGVKVGRPNVVQYVDVELVRRLRAAGYSWSEVIAEHPRSVPTSQGGYKRPGRESLRRAIGEAGKEKEVVNVD